MYSNIQQITKELFFAHVLKHNQIFIARMTCGISLQYNKFPVNENIKDHVPLFLDPVSSLVAYDFRIRKFDVFVTDVLLSKNTFFNGLDDPTSVSCNGYRLSASFIYSIYEKYEYNLLNNIGTLV